MAMTADVSSNHHSPRGGGGDISSPRVQRKQLPSPWAQVVRGDIDASPVASQPQSPPPQESASTPASAAVPEQNSSPPPLPVEDVHSVSETSDQNVSNAASGRPKKPAWNKPPLNEGTAAVTDARPLIGDAVSWPELSKSSKPASRVGPADPSSSRAVAQGSNSIAQGLASVSHPSRKQVPPANNPNPSPVPHPTVPSRPRQNKRNGGNFHPSVVAPVHTPPPVPSPPPLPPYPLYQMAPNTYPNMVMADPSMREHRPGRYPSHPRNSSHRNNFVPHPRGEGQRGYGTGRDVNVQSHRANARAFMRSPPPPPPPAPNPPSTPFLHSAGRPFMTPVPYHEMPPLYYPGVPVDLYRGPMVYPNGPAFPVFYPVTEPVLALTRQIEYYFSDDNLAKDEFLKSKMDNEGWVPISLIASFPRVKSITANAQLILDSLKNSKVVEVQDERIRRRSEWMKWVWAPIHSSSEGGSTSSQNALAASLQNMELVEATSNSSQTGQPEHPDGENIDNAKPNHN